MDRRISEMFTIGGTGILLNKYLGPTTQGNQLTTSTAQTVMGTTLEFADTSTININDFVTSANIPPNTFVQSKNSGSITLSASTTSPVGSGITVGFSADATQPSYANQSEQNIQDLLWMENRDRKYDTSVYKMRGIYQRADQDFDLSQFGLFLQTGTIFMVFHLRDMVDMIGRKLMNGDVVELQHLKDDDGLVQDVPAALKRYYSVNDASFASEGFSPTWWPHLWRVKLNPLVDSQEYKDILNNVAAGPTTNMPVGDILSTIQQYQNINQAVVAQAEYDVPKSGYDTSSFYQVPHDGESPLHKAKGYLVGDGLAPDGLTTAAGIAFPSNSAAGTYFLRLDYVPNRLFRFDGNVWRKIEDDVRTDITPGIDNQTQRGRFQNDNDTFTDSSGVTHPVLQPLNQLLKPTADN